jgi:hypothetical protein
VDHDQLCDRAAGIIRPCVDGFGEILIRGVERFKPEGIRPLSVVLVDLPDNPGFIDFPKLMESLRPHGDVSGPVVRRGRRGTLVEVECRGESRDLLIHVFVD